MAFERASTQDSVIISLSVGGGFKPPPTALTEHPSAVFLYSSLYLESVIRILPLADIKRTASSPLEPVRYAIFSFFLTRKASRDLAAINLINFFCLSM